MGRNKGRQMGLKEAYSRIRENYPRGKGFPVELFVVEDAIKALSVIIDKNVVPNLLKGSQCADDYNRFSNLTNRMLTPREYLLLKKFLGNNENERKQ